MSAVLAVVVVLVGLVVPAGVGVAAEGVPVAGWRVHGVVRSVLVVGSTTFVGGEFERVSGPGGVSVGRSNLAAFDAGSGALVEGFRADADGRVNALASDGRTLWVGGQFRSIGGVARDRLAAVDVGSGAVRSFRVELSGDVYALDLAGGRLFVGGSFLWAGGERRSSAVAFDAVSGVLDGRWRPEPDDTVLALEVAEGGDVVFVGGWFERVGGAARRGVAAVSASSGVASSAVFGGVVLPVLSLAADGDGRLFGGLGGRGDVGHDVVGWEVSSGRRLWHHKADGDVQAVAHHEGVVYFGFHEGFEGDRSVRLLGASASTGAVSRRFRPVFDRFWGVYALDVTDEVVAVGGDFSEVNGVPAEGLVQFASPDIGDLTGSPPLASPGSVPFSDIESDAHFEAIAKVAAAGIVEGYPDGSFRPDLPATRGQVASFLARALDLPPGPSTAFTDVEGDVHERAIGAATGAGIVVGYRDGSYRPAETVTREQMATMSARAFELPPLGSTGFTDVSGVHAPAIGAVSSAGIARGYPDGTYRPGEPVTRSQVASFLARALEL